MFGRGVKTLSIPYFYSESVNIMKSFGDLIKDNSTTLLKIPILNSQYKLSEIVPDFNQMSWNLSKISSFGDKNVLCFDSLPDYAVNYVKLYMLFKIHKECKGNTLKMIFNNLNRIFKTIESFHPGLSSISQITLNNLVMAETRNREGKEIAEFLYLITELGTVSLSFNVAEYENELQKRKTPISYQLIPKALFKRILDVTNQVMNDYNAPVNDRIMACSIRIFTQIAPRISEFLHFKVGQIVYHHVPGRGNVCYLHYTTSKTESGSNERIVEVPMNYIAEEAYNRLIELRKKVPCYNTSDILYSSCEDNHLPVNQNCFRRRYIEFFMKYLEREIHESYENFDGIFYNNKQYSIPSTHSYRVNVVTELYSKKVGLDYIRRRMSHLTHLSEATYIRPSLPSAGEAEYVENLIDREREKMEANSPEVDVGKVKNFLKNNKPRIAKMNSSDFLNTMQNPRFVSLNSGICMKGLEAIISKLQAPTVITADDESDYSQLVFDLEDFRCKREYYCSLTEQARYAESEILRTELNLKANRLLRALDRLKDECVSVGEDNFVFDNPELEDTVINLSNVIREITNWRQA